MTVIPEDAAASNAGPVPSTPPQDVRRAPVRRRDIDWSDEPWTAAHWLGAIVVVTLTLGIGLNIWPGWTRLF